MKVPMHLADLQFDPRYAACPLAVVVTGKPELDEHNQRLLRKKQTGFWVIAEGRLREGDAVFVLLPDSARSDGYPRKVYGGIIVRTRVVGPDRRLLIDVGDFRHEATVSAEIKVYLGGKTPPQGNRANVVWTFTKNSASRLDKSIIEATTRSATDTAQARRARLANAPKLPAVVLATTTMFLRNPDVIAEALYLADGKCQGCRKRAPFLRRISNAPYLEVHHVKTLAEGGEDTVANAVALCPNCHRKAHFGAQEI